MTKYAIAVERTNSVKFMASDYVKDETGEIALFETYNEAVAEAVKLKLYSQNNAVEIIEF